METESTAIKSPENDPYINGIKCCFSQINDLASSINIKEINTETSKYKYETKQSKEGKSQNCICFQTVSIFPKMCKTLRKMALRSSQKVDLSLMFLLSKRLKTFILLAKDY
jgi:hypothetical protein